MNRLKKIISELDNPAFTTIENILLKNKADNFLFVFQSYRNSSITDDEIVGKLELNKNSFYVLKSRLYEKIQEHLTSDVSLNKEDILLQLQQINDICYNSPRGIAVAFLHKLEKELLLFDMHYELRLIYSALKKLHLYSDRYFHYSQLYNKQIALGASLDKCEELLGDFNRILAQYNFSRSQDYIEKLLFLKKEILNHYALNPSRQIALIKNMCDLQLLVLCKLRQDGNLNIQQLFQATRSIIAELPSSSPYKNWEVLLDYLSFEYQIQASELKLAGELFEGLNTKINNLLLYTSICNTSRFLPSKIRYLQESGNISQLAEQSVKDINFDPNDMHTKVLLSIYESMLLYYAGNYKQAIKCLIEVINVYSFKDFFHINIEIKLTLAFFYIKLKDTERASFILNTLSRKIKSGDSEDYTNALNIIKLFNSELTLNSKPVSSKQKDLLALFIARNTNEREILQHLVPELKLKYQ